jgi:hypothetical protein
LICAPSALASSESTKRSRPQRARRKGTPETSRAAGPPLARKTRSPCDGIGYEPANAPRHSRAVTTSHTTEYRLTSREVEFGLVSELCQIPPETPGKHRGLRGHSDAHRCCGKSLMESALGRVGVR